MTHEELERLVTFLASTQVRNFEFEHGGQHLKLSVAPRPKTATKVVASCESIRKAKVVESPEMGVLRLTHPQQSERFTALGATVKKGQIIAFVQYKDTLEGVVSEHDGVLARAYATDGAVVGYADILFELE